MTNEERLSKALQDFKTKYPSVTSADLQTFIIGWQEAVKNCFILDIMLSFLNFVREQKPTMVNHCEKINLFELERLVDEFKRL